MRISDWSSAVCSSDLSRLIERLQPLAAGDVGFNGARANGVAANAFIAMRPGNAAGEPHYRMFRRHISEIGRASCGESVCEYVSITVVAGSLKKKKYNLYRIISNVILTKYVKNY